MSAIPASSTQPGDALAGTLQRKELPHVASSVPGREIVQLPITTFTR